MKYFGLMTFLFCLEAFATHKVATVKLLRGEAQVLSMGKSQVLKMEDWVEEGSVVKTAEKSFVKLIFIDKSSMNVGPNSEMKIEKFDGKEAGVIDVVKGQIRSQVTKDYLQIKDQEKSKLFMKTGNAVMGVRGTDFMITTNGINTATVLFEGEVVFNSLSGQSVGFSPSQLDGIVDQGVKIRPGEFSVVQADLPQPTVPSTLNLQQREALEKNVNMETVERGPGSTAEAPAKSVVPDGLSGATVSNSSDNLKSQVAEAIASAPTPPAAVAPVGDAAGYVSGDSIKPANGSFLHLDSGSIVPPPPGSVLDPNTNTFIPAPGNGSVSASGNFIPPAGVEITGEGKVLVSVTTSTGEQKTVEVRPAPPVLSGASATLAQVTVLINTTPHLQNQSAPISSATIAQQTHATTPAFSPVMDRVPTGAPTPAEYQVIQIYNPPSGHGNLDIEVIK